MNTPLTLKAKIQLTQRIGEANSLSVTTTCPERPDLQTRYSVGLKLSHQRLAERLVRAFDAGVAYRQLRVATDCDGKEYLTFYPNFLGRTLNRDLTRLGF